MPAKHELRQVVPPPPPPQTVASPTVAMPAIHPQADTLYFDAAPVFSHTAGVVAVTLTARRHLPDGRGGVIEQDVVVGFLRCGLQGAESLGQALQGAALLGRPTESLGRN